MSIQKRRFSVGNLPISRLGYEVYDAIERAFGVGRGGLRREVWEEAWWCLPYGLRRWFGRVVGLGQTVSGEDAAAVADFERIFARYEQADKAAADTHNGGQNTGSNET